MRTLWTAAAVLVGPGSAAADDMAIAGLDRCLAAVEEVHAPALIEVMDCPIGRDRCFPIAAAQADINCLTFAADMCQYLTETHGTCLSALAAHSMARATSLRARLPDSDDLDAELGTFDGRSAVRRLEEFDAGEGGLTGPCTPPPSVPAEPFCAYLDASLVLQGVRSSARTIGVEADLP